MTLPPQPSGSSQKPVYCSRPFLLTHTVPQHFMSKRNNFIPASSSLTPQDVVHCLCLCSDPSLLSVLPASPAFLPAHCQPCSVPESIRLLLCCLQKQSSMSPILWTIPWDCGYTTLEILLDLFLFQLVKMYLFFFLLLKCSRTAAHEYNL